MTSPVKCYALNKPFGILSQFTNEGGHPGLSSLNLALPKDVYPVGRLDRDSEGLLILSNDSRLIHQLLQPANEHPRTYAVQVEGTANREQLESLSVPMVLRIKKQEFKTKKCTVLAVEDPLFPERNPPIRERKSIPTSWLSLTLTEGKNRQVRKMTAHVGLPTLRLVRTAIGGLRLDELSIPPGAAVELTEVQISQLEALGKGH